MAKKQDMAALLDKFEADAAKEHDKKEAKASVSADASEGRATSLVSMTKSDKERLTAIAKAHGLSLSAFSVWLPTSTSRTMSGKGGKRIDGKEFDGGCGTRFGA